jgi:hypothetical protein
VSKGRVAKLERPWLAGLVDTLVGSQLLSSSSIPHRNRLAVLLIDSAFETACRAYLRYVAKIPLEESHKHRENLVKATKAKLLGIDDIVWETIDFNYQEIRNDLYHQASAKTVTDESLLAYRESVEFVIDKAFGVDSSQYVNVAMQHMFDSADTGKRNEASVQNVLMTTVPDTVDKLVLAIAATSPQSYLDVKQYMRKQGENTKLSSKEFTNIVARHSGSKRLFYLRVPNSQCSR